MYKLFHVIGAWMLRRRLGTLDDTADTSSVKAGDVLLVLSNYSRELDNVIAELEQVFVKRGHRVEIIAYFNDTVLHTLVPFSYFNNKEVDWKGRPKGDWVETLKSRSWKYVLDTSQSPQLPVAWLVSMLKAGVKIGLSEYPNLYHIVLEGHSADLGKLPTHLETLLTTLNAKIYANS